MNFGIPQQNQPTTPAVPRQTYTRRVDAAWFYYVLAAVGAVCTCHFALSFLVATPVGINGVCLALGGAGLVFHCILSYWTNKFKEATMWLLWMQSGFLIAVSFYIGAIKCL